MKVKGGWLGADLVGKGLPPRGVVDVWGFEGAVKGGWLGFELEGKGFPPGDVELSGPGAPTELLWNDGSCEEDGATGNVSEPMGSEDAGCDLPDPGLTCVSVVLGVDSGGRGCSLVFVGDEGSTGFVVTGAGGCTSVLDE